ncbi:MAG: DEAD/DEAH box helicase [Ignavibacteriae bacterium]|nr:MAG: DEAD/DEAH box helicase [Ignavibacteriota bacterium]
MSFSKLGLADELVQGILATGYTAPTAIQERAIPLAVAGRDIIGCAQTGTGKTAAFALPMLNHFIKERPAIKGHLTRGLILTPTRELAQQGEEFISAYGRFAGLQSMSIFGGVNMENQIRRLRRGVDIIVATPGRLLDHISRRTVDLSHVEILVLDEADRMFDMGFIDDVRKIIAKIPAKRQTLLFSATMSKEVRGLVASIQVNPEMIEIGVLRHPVDAVKQYFYSSPQDSKMDLLLHILKTEEMDTILVFSRTKHGADKICNKLERAGIKAIAIHSNRTQAQRQRALAGFKQGQYKVMVATDIAARGIDVEGISHVVNFDTPTFAEDYIHRIGRTGRASATGDAITFVSTQEQKYLKSIERYTDKHFELKRYPGFDYAKRPAVAGKHDDEKSPRERREGGHGRRDDHRERRHSESSGKPYRDHRRTESTGRPPSEHRRTESGRTQSDHRRTESTGRPQSEHRRPESASRPHNEQRRSEYSGKPRNEFKPREHRDDEKHRQSFSAEKPKFVKKASSSVPPAQTGDWRSLMATMEEERGGFKKKLKRLFIRDKA